MPVMLIPGSPPQRTSEDELLWDWDGVDSIRKIGYAVEKIESLQTLCL
jgi:hypothetical protein